MWSVWPGKDSRIRVENLDAWPHLVAKLPPRDE